MNIEALGERIRLARIRLNLSRSSLAELAGTSPATIRNIENGGPGVAYAAVERVANALGLELVPRGLPVVPRPCECKTVVKIGGRLCCWSCGDTKGRA